jgi:hypothetical protein
LAGHRWAGLRTGLTIQTCPANPLGIFGAGLFMTPAAQTCPKTWQVKGTRWAAPAHFDPDVPPIPFGIVCPEGFVMSIALEWWVLLVSLLSDEFPTPSSSPSSYEFPLQLFNPTTRIFSFPKSLQNKTYS